MNPPLLVVAITANVVIGGNLIWRPLGFLQVVAREQRVLGSFVSHRATDSCAVALRVCPTSRAEIGGRT
jgi:hypothetical protein